MANSEGGAWYTPTCPQSLYVAASMFTNHDGIEQVKLWCVVRSLCVVFAVKYISSCVCGSTFEHLYSFYVKL